jgi:hypothetical protein
MAAIPHQDRDPTLEAVDAAIEARGNAEPERPYLGMSEVGRECGRALWYGFRWCSPKAFDAAALKRFEDGHLGESLQAARLRLVAGITLYTEDPRTPGHQFGFQDLGGHFRGHMDGVILGLLQSVKTWHVWENKQVGDDKQRKLLKDKATKGEKAALESWDPIYYAQAQLYMHYSGLTRHYLTCASAGGRNTVSVRTDAVPQAAQALIEKARRIITASEPLTRLSERPDWYQCKWCDHRAVCHEGAVPQATCRTCAHATPELDGDGRWSCAWFSCDLSVDVQRQGGECPAHVFIPALLSGWQVLDADPAAGWVDYRMPNGRQVRNGPGGWASRELAAGAHLVGDPVVEGLRSQFGAEVVG